jgi:hypothetical protein
MVNSTFFEEDLGQPQPFAAGISESQSSTMHQQLHDSPNLWLGAFHDSSLGGSGIRIRASPQGAKETQAH